MLATFYTFSFPRTPFFSVGTLPAPGRLQLVPRTHLLRPLMPSTPPSLPPHTCMHCEWVLQLERLDVMGFIGALGEAGGPTVAAHITDWAAATMKATPRKRSRSVLFFSLRGWPHGTGWFRGHCPCACVLYCLHLCCGPLHVAIRNHVYLRPSLAKDVC
jgi:hypothetical protein